MGWLPSKAKNRAPRGAPATILFWIALAMLVVWLATEWLGLGDSPSFAGSQRTLLISAVAVFLISRLPLPSFPKYVRLTNLGLPTASETLALGLLAILMTAIDILWSSRAGLLAYPPYYDGISYVFDSKRAFYFLGSWGKKPQILGDAPFNLLLAPLWELLMMIHYLALGAGEWQAYTVRFWPEFLLLYLIFWVVRNRSNGRIAWMAVSFTSLLPTMSVGIRTTVLEFYFRKTDIGWYLADLRPDFLFAVLLLWTIVPLVEYACKLDSRLWLISGTAAGLAVLTKPSAASLLAVAWGLAFLTMLLINRAKIQETISVSLWGFSPFLVLLFPWGVLGGFVSTAGYVYAQVFYQRALWSDPNATFWTEATYYWRLFSSHMGQAEGWVFLVCGLAAFVLDICRKFPSSDMRSGTYLMLAFPLYAIVSATPSKNYFLGLPFSLMLWIFSWVKLSPALKVAADKTRPILFLQSVIAALYVVLILWAFWYAVKHWPIEEIPVAARIRATANEIANDLTHILTRSDQFLSANPFGFPATLEYYMVQRDGSFPRHAEFDVLAPPERVINETASRCKAILVFSNSEDQLRYSTAPKPALTVWEAIAQWVKDPRNGYRLIKTYRFPDQTPWSHLSGNFIMELYVREP